MNEFIGTYVENELLTSVLCDIKRFCLKPGECWPIQRAIQYYSNPAWEKIINYLLDEGILICEEDKEGYFLSEAGYVFVNTR